MPSHVPPTQSSTLVPLPNLQFSPESESEQSPPSSLASANSADELSSPDLSPKIPLMVDAPYPRTRSKLQRKDPPASHSQKLPLSPEKIRPKAGMSGSRNWKNCELSFLRVHSTAPECISDVFCLWPFSRLSMLEKIVQ